MSSIYRSITNIVNPITVVIKISQGIHLEFAAEKQVGFRKEGEVVVKEQAQKTLHEYRLRIQEKNVYQKSRSEDFPPDVNDASIRSSSGPSTFLQDNNTATLKLAFHNLKPWKILHHEGILLPCSRIKHVYAVEKTDSEYEIIINDYEFNGGLQPASGRPTWKDPYLSVCTDRVTSIDRIAVTSTNRTLGIYSKGSK